MPDPAQSTDLAVILDGRAIPFTLRRSARARWVSCWIRPEAGLVVTVPDGRSAADAEAFLRRHSRWVLRETARLERRFAGVPKVWPFSRQLFFRGEPHEVRTRTGRPGQVVRSQAPAQLAVVSPSGDIPGTRQVLQRWLKQEAGLVLAERVIALGERMGLCAKRIYVRNLRCRWGSCWPGGSLSFNYRLVMAPPAILDYVVVHELAHLRQPNHSTDFWAIVAEHDPAYRRAREWLRMFGPSLTV